MELEKKYLLEDPPEDLYKSHSTPIEQVYVIVTEKEELRVRNKGSKFLLTLKKGSGTARQEVEINIFEEQYKLFAQQVVGEVIHKKRLEYPVQGLTAEIDVYEDHLEGLAVVEVEFPSSECMEAFSAPSWFGEEVSLMEEFKNKNLALNGFPAHLVRRWKQGARPAWHYRQAGVVPFRKSDAGCEVLLITSRGAGRWIIPKGIIEPYLSPADSAAKEALEEAGASGTVLDRISEAYSYEKWNGTCTVTLFPLLVTEIHSQWAEEGVRERGWVGQEEIEDYVENTEMARAIVKLLSELQ